MNLTNNIIAKRENNQSDPSISNMLRHQGGFFWLLLRAISLTVQIMVK